MVRLAHRMGRLRASLATRATTVINASHMLAHAPMEHVLRRRLEPRRTIVGLAMLAMICRKRNARHMLAHAPMEHLLSRHLEPRRTIVGFAMMAMICRKRNARHLLAHA